MLSNKEICFQSGKKRDFIESKNSDFKLREVVKVLSRDYNLKGWLIVG